jgi:hypothetical protein
MEGFFIAIAAIAALLVFDMLAITFGADTRDGFGG